MISDVYHVKLYRGQYDGTAPIAPTSTDDNTKGFYVGFRLLVKADGQTYICSDAETGAAVWVIDAEYDERIEQSLRGISGLVTRYCDKIFTSYPPDYYESVGVIYGENTLTDLSAYFSTYFFPGDSILILGSKRNDGFYRLTDVTDTVLTIEGTFPLEIPDDNQQIVIGMTWPKGLSEIGARMVEYDVFRRNQSPGLSGESMVSYSSTKEVTDIYGTGYPDSVTAGIQSFKRPRVADGSVLGFRSYEARF